MQRPGILSVRYGHYDYQYLSESQHVRIVSSDNVDDLKIVEDHEITSNVKDTLVGSGTPIIDEIRVSSNSINDVVDEIVESNIPAMPSKSFEFSCADYWFMVVPIELSSSE